MADVVVSRLTAILGFDVDRRGLRQAENGLNRIATGARNVVGILASGLIARGFGNLITGAVASADELAKTSRAIGLTAAELENLRFAAERSGVSQSLLDQSLRRFTKRVGLADKGTGEAVKTYQELGISLRDSSGEIRNTQDLITEIAGVLDGFGSQAEKTAVLVKLFGDEAQALINIFEGGPEALQDLLGASAEFGNITNEQAASAEQFADRLTNLTTSFTRLRREILIDILPVFESIIEQFTGVIQAARNTGLAELLSQTSAVRAALVVLGIAVTALLAPFAPLVATVGLAFLAFEDFFATLEGRDSLIQSIVDGLFGIGTTAGVIQSLNQEFGGLNGLLLILGQTTLQTFADAWEVLVFAVREAQDAVFVAGNAIFDILDNLRIAFNNIAFTITNLFTEVIPQAIQNGLGALGNFASSVGQFFGIGPAELNAPAQATTTVQPTASPAAVAGNANVTQSNQIEVNLTAQTNANPEEIGASVREVIRAEMNQSAADIQDAIVAN